MDRAVETAAAARASGTRRWMRGWNVFMGFSLLSRYRGWTGQTRSRILLTLPELRPKHRERGKRLGALVLLGLRDHAGQESIVVLPLVELCCPPPPANAVGGIERGRVRGFKERVIVGLVRRVAGHVRDVALGCLFRFLAR